MDKYAFTADALIKSILLYGEKVFKLHPIIYKPALLELYKDCDLYNNYSIKLIKQHWFEIDLRDEYFPIDGNILEEEIKYIKSLDKFYPDCL